MMNKLRFSFPTFFFAILLSTAFLFSCGGKKKTKTTETTTTSTTSSSSSSTAAQEKPKEVEGGALNEFFPKEADGFKVIYNQEKEGFAQASLKKEGKEVATLAITDLNDNQDTKAKYTSSDMKIASYPARKKGSKGHSILVGDRYQVDVRSKDASFTEEMRKEWFSKFDLKGLANLK